MMRQTDGGLFLPDKRLLMPKHHGSRYPAVIGGPGSAGGGGAPFTGLMRADFESGADLTVYGGDPTGTLTGAAAVTGGYLDLIDGGYNTVQYGMDSNWQPTTEGCINMLYYPYYTGTPPQSQYLFWRGRTGNSWNYIMCQHSSVTGNIRVWAQQANGTTINDADLGNWAPTAGTTYEVEVNFDFTLGDIRVFIDGSLHGAYTGKTGTLTVEAGNIMKIGEGYNSNQNQSRFRMYDFKVYETVQHTSAY